MKLKKLFASALAILTVFSAFSTMNTASAATWVSSPEFIITDTSGTSGYVVAGYVDSGDSFIGNVTEISYNVNLNWVKGCSKSIGSNLPHKIKISTSRGKGNTYASAASSTTVYTEWYLKGDWFKLQGSAEIGS